MADTAFQRQYRQEFIAGFEVHQSLLRDSVTTESVVKGNEALFLVADSGGDTATTRGVNGMIPAQVDNLAQKTATLVEWHDLRRKTDFNIFASQGNVRQIMQRSTMAVMNRKIDSDILGQLTAGTQFAGLTASTASYDLAIKSKTILGNADVPFDGQICAAITPAFEGYLLKVKEFANSEYVTKKPIDNAVTAWKDAPGWYSWIGVKWIVHPSLPGAATSAEECYMWHKDAIGHAVDSSGLSCPVGYHEEQAYSWARCSIHMGSILLQDTGVVQIRHDGSAFAVTQ